MAGIDQVIPDYRAEIVGGTGPDIGAAVIRVAITGSGYHTIALSLSLSLAGRVPGHGDYRDYLQCRVS